MNKKLLLLSILSLVGTSVLGGDYFVSYQGGVWSNPATWEKNSLPKDPVALRMSVSSGNLEVDGDRHLYNWSVWDKYHNIHILDGATLTLGANGFNQQKSGMCISGSDF